MCGAELPRRAKDSAAMAAIFQEQSHLGCVYFHELKSGGTALSTDVMPVDKCSDRQSGSPLVQIHAFGAVAWNHENPILHSIPLDGISKCTVGLTLNSSDEGVIGRGLSIVDQNGIVLGSGVIGWS